LAAQARRSGIRRGAEDAAPPNPVRRKFRKERPGSNGPAACWFSSLFPVFSITVASKMSQISPFRLGHINETKQVHLNGTISHQRETTSPKTAHDLAGKCITTYSSMEVILSNTWKGYQSRLEDVHVRFAILAEQTVVKYHRQPNISTNQN
jgi:hypothetical protein